MAETAVRLRPFKIPLPQESQFFTIDETENKRFMIEDLAKSGLDPDDIFAYTTPLLKKEGATAAYGIPYYGPDGKVLTSHDGFPSMWRARFRYPEFSKEQRYTQPNAEQLAKCGLPSFVPYFPPKFFETGGGTDTIICCEGEKKAACVVKYLNLPAFGIGGCEMWRDPSGSGTVHQWILNAAQQRGATKFLIIPDGDVLRYDICRAYGTFAHSLRERGFGVEIVSTGGKIDDLLCGWSNKSETFAALPRIDPTSLVQSPNSLIQRFNLSFKRDQKGNVTVYQHTANVMKLMEEHNAFPKIWRNLDNNRVMVGEAMARPDITEMDIANYFQHNLGFDKVTHRIIYSCIQALARRNDRSPMLEYLKSQSWDGTKRLSTWLQRLWGVVDSPIAQEVSAKWLVGACARMDRPGTKIDWMPIIVGPQGTGKTSMPGILFKGATITLYGDHNDKDLHMLLHSALCVGFDELDSFGRRESSTLKAMITRNEDSFRPPYGASVEIFPRRFTLYGCGNRYEFLQHDPSGYRRYAVVEVTRLLDFMGLEGERDQLWAEAWNIYQSGTCKFWEVEDASENAKKYVVPNTLEDQINSLISNWRESKINSLVKDNFIYFSMQTLLSGLQMEREGRNPNVTREVAAILRSMGVEQQNGTMPVGQYRGRYYRLKV